MLLIFLSVVLLLIAGLLFVPIILRIDTVNEVYCVMVRGIMSFRITQENEELLFELSLPFYRKKIFPLRPGKKTSEEAEKADAKEHVKKKSTGKKKSRMSLSKVIAMLRTFHIRDFMCTMDTGDYVRNAWLVPVLQAADQYRNRLTINFQGEFAMRFIASNNLWRLGRAYLTS